MNLDSLIEIVNCKLLENQHRRLNNAEIIMLEGIWQGNTYHQIAVESGYSKGYLAQVVAPDLFRCLAEIISQPIGKRNCRKLLESYCRAETAVTQNKQSLRDPLDLQKRSAPQYRQDSLKIPYPNGSVPLSSPFYIPREPIESRVTSEIDKPGSLVRIKAPREMGKTSLLLRMIDYAQGQRYRTVSLNLEQIDQAILKDLNRFLRWLCTNVTRQLQLELKLDSYWNEDFGSKVSCTLYFHCYLLPQIDSPLVLALDEVNQIFEHPQVAKDFLPLLRSWYEEGKKSPFWEKLRLIVVHSTEIYVPLHLHQSPFNVGMPVELTDFNLFQVQELARRYGLNWEGEEFPRQLMDLVGGHPALIQMALYHLSTGEMTLQQLLQEAPTSTGIYCDRLQRHLAMFKDESELTLALRNIMLAKKPVELEPLFAHKLKSTGLIRFVEDKAIPSCQLYRLYFQNF